MIRTRDQSRPWQTRQHRTVGERTKHAQYCDATSFRRGNLETHTVADIASDINGEVTADCESHACVS